MRVLIFLAVTALSPFANGSGASGQYVTISAAIAASRNGDMVFVKKGVYRESFVLNGKAVSILGIEPNQRDVIVQPLTTQPALSIKNHPAGRVSRFSRFTIIGADQGASILSNATKGDLVFEFVDTTTPSSFSGHQGTLALTACSMQSPGMALTASGIQRFLCHDCQVLATRSMGSGIHLPQNMTITNSDAHVSHCTIKGVSGSTSKWTAYPGGTALTLISSTVRVSGLLSDKISGGDGITVGSKTSEGGIGIDLRSSRLTISGVKVTGGLGAVWGTTVRTPAILPDRNSSVVHAKPAMPVIVTHPAIPVLKPFSRGFQTGVDLHASPGALSLTWIAVEFRPTATPWGSFVIDLNKPMFVGLLTHDTSGKTSFNLDLRALSLTLVGIQYAVQTLALDTGNNLSLSGPRIGVVGF